MLESWVWRAEVCDWGSESWVCSLLVPVGVVVEGDGSGRMGFSAGGGTTGSWLASFASGDRGAGGSWMEGPCVSSPSDVEDLACVGAVGIGGEGALSVAGSAAVFSSAGTSAACASGSASLSDFAESFVARFAVAF